MTVILQKIHLSNSNVSVRPAPQLPMSTSVETNRDLVLTDTAMAVADVPPELSGLGIPSRLERENASVKTTGYLPHGPHAAPVATAAASRIPNITLLIWPAHRLRSYVWTSKLTNSDIDNVIVKLLGEEDHFKLETRFDLHL